MLMLKNINFKTVPLPPSTVFYRDRREPTN